MKGPYKQKTQTWSGNSKSGSSSAMGGKKDGGSSGGKGSRHRYAMGGNTYKPVAGMLTHSGKVENQPAQAACSK
jgi:hypothetical protein